ENGADLGVATDGDGDRVGFLTHEGERVPADFITALLGSFFARKEPGAKVVYDIRSSRVVPEAIEEAGGIAIKSKIGYPFLRALMRENDAVFGGEVSSHYYFRSFFSADSALFTFLQILMILSESGRTLKELISPFNKYFSSGEINRKVADLDRTIDKIAEHFKDAEETSYLDGFLARYPDFWFIARPSNTEPLLRIVMEANTKEVLDRKLAELLAVVEG
ncbi:MAG: phosphomannomutase/phosphoglucomutase, partial [Patescibacteria group bacterium]